MADPRPTIPFALEAIHRRNIAPSLDSALFGGWGVRTLITLTR